MQLNVKRFQGVVTLKDWMHWHDGKTYMGFIGKISILNAEKAIGFEPGHREANWIARVESEDGMSTINILGCQIKAISTCEKPKRIEINYMDVDLI